MIDSPEVRAAGDTVMFLWHAAEIGIGFNYFWEARDGVHGEIEVVRVGPDGSVIGHIHWARLNLASTTARKGLGDYLVKRTSDDGGRTSPVDWPGMIEYACTVGARRHREGAPFVDLSTVPKPPRQSYLVRPLMPTGQTSLIFSKGASGKSLFSMAVAVAASIGKSLPSGLVIEQKTNVLYLDYETDEAEQRSRLDQIVRGMGLASLPHVYYRNQSRPLVADAARLRAEVVRLEIGLVIVDSIAYALQGSLLESDVVIDAFNALRSFGPRVSRLVVAHITKAEKESKEASPYGSVFFENAARSSWELRSQEEKDGITMALYPRKVNWGQKSAPIGLRWTFNDMGESVALSTHPLVGDSELMTHASMTYQLLSALKTGAKTANALAADTASPLDSVRRTLRRLEDRGQLVSMNGHARGEKVWGLVDGGSA